MRIIALAVFLGMLFARLCAQQVQGVVTSVNHNGLALANVVVLTTDSTFVSGTTTDTSGRFAFAQIQRGNIVKVSLVGYQTKYLRYAGEETLNVQLAENAYELGEAVVKAQLPKTMLKGEAMITNVAGTVLEKTASIQQLLNLIPHVSVQNGSVAVFGRGAPEMYINGKRMTSSMELQRIKPEDVKSVEVIANPGARYGKDVTSVIRIDTRRMAGEGLGVDTKTSVTINEQKRISGHETLDLSWRKGGWDVSSTIHGVNAHTPDDERVETFTYLTDTWRQPYEINQELTDTKLYLSLAANYAFNPNTSVGASVHFGRRARDSGRGDVLSSNWRNDELVDEMDTHFALIGARSEVSTNVYFVGKIGKLGVDFNSDYYWRKQNQHLHNQEWYRETGQAETYNEVHSRRNISNRLFANKLVLVAPIAQGELSVGGEYSHSTRNNRYTVLPLNVVDDENNRISEQITAVFAEYSRQFGKLNLQLGLRYEHIDFEFYDNGMRIASKSKRYADWFPSVSLSFPVRAMQMQLAYSSDIKRPAYQQLRSGMQFNNRFTYEVGNPFLLPAVSRNLSYGLLWKWVSFSAMYSHVANAISSLLLPYKNNPKQTLVRPENLPAYKRMQASLSLNPSWGVWQPSFEATLYKQWFKMNTHQGGGLNHLMATFTLTNTFETKWLTASVEMSTNTEGYTENMFMQKGNFCTNVSLYRKCLGGKLLLQLDATNIFATAHENNILYSGDQRTTYTENYSSSTITFTLRYRFNASKGKYKGAGAGQSQKGRM